jgi:N-acetylglucosaminyl-diphospho-decaprenol L-rhamnosyltransferase
MNVDVVIVNYHSGRVLPGSVRAAQSFLGESANFVFVDNSPGDGSRRVMAEVAPGATVIENPRNVGFAAAVNQGIRAGRGDAVMLLNPDIESISGNVKDLEDAFADADVAAVTVRLLNPDGSVPKHIRAQPTLLDLVASAPGVGHRLKRWRRLQRYTLDGWDYADRRVVDTACAACLWLGRAALDDVGPFDERFFFYWEETDWLVRAKERGWKTIFLPSVEAVHATRGSTDEDFDSLEFLRLESEHKYVRKHFGLGGSLLFRGSMLAVDSLRWLRSLPGTSYGGRRGELRRRIAIHLGRGA